jgi:D-alanyl-D-alanine carboxypeptidase/D-alanyl-D-alanine-endopeptidase (penicillin-binding protein 4)
MRSHRCIRLIGGGLALLLAYGVAVASDTGSASRASAPAASTAGAAARPAPPALPAALLTLLRNSGVPLKSFGVSVRPVDAVAPTMSLNGEEPILLASTTKVVTSLAALNLLGATHQWRTQAYATAAPENGRMAGDLVITGGSTGLTPAELRRWFKQMRGEGLAQISGRIVLDKFSLLYEGHPGQAATTAAEAAPGGTPDALTYNRGAMVVVVQPTKGELASVGLQPRTPGVVIVNEMLMGGLSTAVCGARVRWGDAPGPNGGPPPLLVSGRWVTDCGRQEVAFVKLPTAGGAALAVSTSRPPNPAAAAGNATAQSGVSLPGMVATLWAETGGQLRGRVVESPAPVLRATKGRAAAEPPRATRAWASQIVTAMPEVIREMNKTSNNVAARDLLLALATPGAPALRDAQGRVGAWLRGQGLAADDIRIDEGSGQSRVERGRPRAMVQLLVNEWRARDSRVFVDSLPIAGVDGTLANRMRKGPATGRAFLKTGTLSDTRALAGYVMGRSGTVYAVALMVCDPQAARATPALDALVEWLAKNG